MLDSTCQAFEGAAGIFVFVYFVVRFIASNLHEEVIYNC